MQLLTDKDQIEEIRAIEGQLGQVPMVDTTIEAVPAAEDQAEQAQTDKDGHGEGQATGDRLEQLEGGYAEQLLSTGDQSSLH